MLKKLEKKSHPKPQTGHSPGSLLVKRQTTPSPPNQWPALVTRWPLSSTPWPGSRQKNVEQWPPLVATVWWPPLHSNGGVQQWPPLVATVGCRASCTLQWPQLRARAPQKCPTVATKLWSPLVATVESRARPEGGDIQWPLLFFFCGGRGVMASVKQQRS
jgi:hypothetical protein